MSVNSEIDLEERRLLQVRSDRLRSLGEMAAGIAHELNQPLVGVRGIAEHLLIALERGWALPPEKLKEKLGLIVDQAERMSHIIEHVRRFSREADSAEVSPVSINEVVGAALALMGQQLRARGIRVVQRLHPDLPMVLANPFSLEEVVLNLSVNARDALEELAAANPDAELEIAYDTASVADDGRAWVELRVGDRGPGIPPEVLERVFEPFFTTKGPDRGTGLGLAISRSIVEQAGGTLTLSSVPGQGTTARVRLPVATPGGPR